MFEPTLPFDSRMQAGALLAERLQHFRGRRTVTVLALVRGGMVVGQAIAEALKLPLYPYVVRKLGHPTQREFGLGAIAEGGSTYLDEEMMRMHGVSWADMEPVIEAETEELERRKKTYITHARPSLQGKTVILVDDGAATGGTLFAAIEDIRKQGAAEVIVALPVCPPETAARLRQRTDETILLATPAHFDAVGQWYTDFPQVEDDEVIQLLSSPSLRS